jgi:hypothetical protein
MMNEVGDNANFYLIIHNLIYTTMNLEQALKQIAEAILEKNNFDKKIYVDLHHVSKHRSAFNDEVNTLWKGWYCIASIVLDNLVYELVLDSPNTGDKDNAAWFIYAGMTNVRLTKI